MRTILLAFSLTLFVASALAAQTRNYGGKNYSGSDAGYLVMSISQDKVGFFDREAVVILHFRKLDRLVTGFVNYGNHRVLDFAPSTLDFEDASEQGIVIVRALPPGDYEFFDFSGDKEVPTYPTIDPNPSYFRARYSLPFTIKAGETAYLGNFRLVVKPGGNKLLGPPFAAGYYLGLSDRSSRDLAIAHDKKRPAMGRVIVTVPNEAALHAPLFNSNPDVRAVSTNSSVAYSRAWAQIFEIVPTRLPSVWRLPVETRVRQGLSTEKYDSAIKFATEAIDARDLWPYLQSGAYKTRGMARLGLRQYGEAIEDFSRAIAIDPFNDDAFAERAIAYRNQGRFDQAIADQTKVLASFPESVGILSERGLTYLASRQHDLALADFNEAIRRAPKDPVLYGNRGNLYRATGKLDLAITDLSHAIDLKRFQSIDPALYLARGNAYLTGGQFENAFADFDKIIYTRIAGAEHYNGRCVALAAMRKAEAAMRDCEKALMMDGKSAEAHYSRGYAYFKLGQFDRAIEDYNAAIGTEPRAASSLYGRGVAKMKSGDAEGGTLDVNDARRIDGEIADKMAKLGVAP